MYQLEQNRFFISELRSEKFHENAWFCQSSQLKTLIFLNPSFQLIPSTEERKQVISTMSKRIKRSSMQLESLPDEILLEIFSYMNMQELLQYGQLSKRIRAICSDTSFWKDIFLVSKKVKAEFIKFILERSCNLLLIEDTVIDGSVKLNKTSELAYLELSCWNVYATKDFYHEFFNSCCSLVSLNMNGMKHSSNIVLQNLCKRNEKTLYSLSLDECQWISKNSLQVISKHCTELTQIDLRYTNVSQDAMDFFVSALSPNVKEVCLACNKDTMTDRQIETLVSRCNKITELDISCSELTDASITSVIKHLKQSLKKLDISGFSKVLMTFEKVLELKSMPNLEVLNYGFKSWHTMVLRKKLPHLKINED